jgi:hypothetical protein
LVILPLKTEPTSQPKTLYWRQKHDLLMRGVSFVLEYLCTYSTPTEIEALYEMHSVSWHVATA